MKSPLIFHGQYAKVLPSGGVEFFDNKLILTGALDPSVTAVNAPAGSIYLSSSATAYIKQDAGSTTNWLPLGIATPGSLTTINGQSGPAVTIVTGTAGTDFVINTASNVVTLDIPSSSASNRGLLTSANWTTFNNKEPAVTATTSADYYRGDKTFQTLNTLAVPELTNLYYTNARGISSVITGFVSGAGVVAATDTMLQAINKLDGNIAGKQASGNYITALTGDVTASGPGSVAGTIANNAVTNAKLAQMAAHTFKGNNTAGTANALDLTATQLTAELNLATTSVKGLAPVLSNVATEFLNGTGVYSTPTTAVGNSAYSAKTTTYTTLITDDVLSFDTSGGSFTLNLITAVGNTGKIYTLVKTSSDLNSVTIDGNGTQTIRGLTTVHLRTQDEIWRIVSDGANWQSLEHSTSSRQSAAQNITFTATTTNPTKGTVLTDNVVWFREGKYALISYNYEQSTAGTNGSGAYLMSLPTNLSFDNTFANVSYNTTAAGTNDAQGAGVLQSSMSSARGANTAGQSGFAHMRDATTFYVSSEGGLWGSAFVGGFSTASFRFAGWVKVPISGWEE